MPEDGKQILEFAERAARDRFRTIALRTQPMTPDLAAAVLRRLPQEGGFDPQKIASHLEALPQETGEAVQVGKSASQAFVAVAIPHPADRAFAWAQQLMADTSATSLKMNLGPGKPTDVKVFWGKPEVNTLIGIGGEE